MTISDAAKLVRKARATLVRDIESGRLTKTVLQDGDVRIDTAELLRAYGRLHHPQATEKNRDTRNKSLSADKTRIALLEERIRSLERVIVLEAELRRVKDQVTTELRTRLADKDHMIKILESKILFLEYDKQTLATRTVPTLEPEQPAPARTAPSASPDEPGKGTDTQEKIKAWPAPPKQEATAATTPSPATVKSTPPSPRAPQGAPGGIERRRPAGKTRWWQRLFSGKPPNR